MLQSKTDSEHNAAGQALIPTSVSLLQPFILRERKESRELTTSIVTFFKCNWRCHNEIRYQQKETTRRCKSKTRHGLEDAI